MPKPASTHTCEAGVTDLAEAIGSGAVTVEGDAGALVELFGLLEDPEYTFAIVTP